MYLAGDDGGDDDDENASVGLPAELRLSRPHFCVLLHSPKRCWALTEA